MSIAGVLLAAGRSSRFGPGDKLLSDFNGAPLVRRAAQALLGAGVDHLIAVVHSPAVAAQLPEFAHRYVAAQGLQSDSLRAGISAAEQAGATHTLIALGDMPFVTAAVLQNVLKRATVSRPAAATDGQHRAPPVCFPRASFHAVQALRGDTGGRDVLRELPNEALVHVDAQTLFDVDTTMALNQAIQMAAHRRLAN